MIWLGTIVAFVMFFTLANSPARMIIVGTIALGWGSQEWMDTGSFIAGYELFLILLFWVTFVLSPWLWACFGLGAFVGYKAGGK